MNHLMMDRDCVEEKWIGWQPSSNPDPSGLHRTVRSVKQETLAPNS
jgi:hypothetical protein